MLRTVLIYGAILAAATLALEWLQFRFLVQTHAAERVAVTFVERFPIGVLISLFSAALLRNSRFLPAR